MIPPIVFRVDAILSGNNADEYTSDISTSQLEYVQRWAIKNGSESLQIAIENELEQRFVPNDDWEDNVDLPVGYIVTSG